MRYEYSDGLVVDYSDNIHITRGTEIDIFIEKDFIPANIKRDLDEATRRDSREDVRKVALALTDTVGWKACLADVDSKACVNY